MSCCGCVFAICGISDQTVVPEGFGTETSSSTVRGCAALGFGADGGASIITRFERVPMAGLSAGVFAGARALLAGDGREAIESPSQTSGRRAGGALPADALIGAGSGGRFWRVVRVERGGVVRGAPDPARRSDERPRPDQVYQNPKTRSRECELRLYIV